MFGRVVPVVVWYLVCMDAFSEYECMVGTISSFGKQDMKESEFVVVFFVFERHIFSGGVDDL